MKKISGVTIYDCSRCGKDHKNMEVKELTNKTNEFTYWTMCPTLNEPMLFSNSNINKKDDKETYYGY